MRHADGDLGNGVTSGGEIGQADRSPGTAISLLCLSERVCSLVRNPDVPGSIDLSRVGKLIREESRNARESGHLLREGNFIIWNQHSVWERYMYLQVSVRR